MEKASKALRRSGVRIRSIGSGHSDLQMVISQLKDVRVAAKAFSTAQSSCMQDMVKWSLKDENRAIQDALTQVGELFSIWTEVQRDFSENIKEFKHHFDMILEGAKQLDLAKADLQIAEQKEGKLKKELKKAAKKATAEEIREMAEKLAEAEREKDFAQLEVVDRVREHEAVKMIRVKEGLFKFSEAYIDFAQKCDVIFGAQRDIALQIPDVQDKDIQDIKYTGAGSTMQSVAVAKDKIKRFRRRPSSMTSHDPPYCPGSGQEEPHNDLPPPYSENPPLNPFYNDLPRNISSGTVDLSWSQHSLDNQDLNDSGRPLAVSPQQDPDQQARLSPLYPGGGGRRSQSHPPHHPQYPVLPNIPPYEYGHQVISPLGGQVVHLPSDPPPFSSVGGGGGRGRGRRDSYFSDTDDVPDIFLRGNLNMDNLSLQPQ